MDRPAVDTLFLDPTFPDRVFRFDDRVAGVFDDMIGRSIPQYRELQAMIISLVAQLAQERTAIYDLGCSTGTTLALINHHIHTPKLSLIGIDSCLPMLEKAKAKLSTTPEQHPVQFLSSDLNQPQQWEPASVVIINLVLQFLDLERRLPLLKDLYQSLLPGGAVILIEKITPDSSDLKDLYTTIYHDYKRSNGYSQIEIDRKQKALTTSLLPLTLSENKTLLVSAGFSRVESFFQWFNFSGLLAVK